MLRRFYTVYDVREVSRPLRLFLPIFVHKTPLPIWFEVLIKLPSCTILGELLWYLKMSSKKYKHIVVKFIAKTERHVARHFDPCAGITWNKELVLVISSYSSLQFVWWSVAHEVIWLELRLSCCVWLRMGLWHSSALEYTFLFYSKV